MITIPKMHSFEKRTGVADPTFLLEVEWIGKRTGTGTESYSVAMMHCPTSRLRARLRKNLRGRAWGCQVKEGSVGGR